MVMGGIDSLKGSEIQQDKNNFRSYDDNGEAVGAPVQ